MSPLHTFLLKQPHFLFDYGHLRTNEHVQRELLNVNFHANNSK